jgi:hypothetical protein
MASVNGREEGKQSSVFGAGRAERERRRSGSRGAATLGRAWDATRRAVAAATRPGRGRLSAAAAQQGRKRRGPRGPDRWGPRAMERAVGGMGRGRLGLMGQIGLCG